MRLELIQSGPPADGLEERDGGGGEALSSPPSPGLYTRKQVKWDVEHICNFEQANGCGNCLLFATLFTI